MRRLLEDYKRRLRTLDEELRATINEATDLSKITRLTIMRGCYKTFIFELEQIVPPEKPIDPKTLKAERKRQEEADRIEMEKNKDETDKFFKIGKYAEPDQPEDF